MDPVEFAAKHDTDPISIAVCDAEINAETATSRAASRRALNFSRQPEDGEPSETQKHDLWDKPANDPADW
jgi:hypothetical protein